MFEDELLDDCLDRFLLLFAQESADDSSCLLFGECDKVQVEDFLGVFVENTHLELLLDQASDQKEAADILGSQLLIQKITEELEVSFLGFIDFNSLQNVQDGLQKRLDV